MFSVKLTVTSRQQNSMRVTGLSQVNGVTRASPFPPHVHLRTIDAP